MSSNDKQTIDNESAVDADSAPRRAFDEAASDADQLAADLAAANDRLLRLQAEMQNLRNRTSREIADERRYSALPILRELSCCPSSTTSNGPSKRPKRRAKLRTCWKASDLCASNSRQFCLSTNANRLKRWVSRLTRTSIKPSCTSHRPMYRPTP
jgi:hypothetical protein